MASLTPSPKMQFFDANGNPLVGGKLYTYSAGTTSPLATYTDSTGTSANTNPIILDSRGEANVWLGVGSYKMVLKDSVDALIWTVDNILGAPSSNAALVALAASDGSSLVGFIQSGTGAVATTVQAKLRETVSVKDFGAVGDGTTDDTAAIQAAVTASANNKLFFPAGTYLFSSTINLVSNITIDFGLATLKVKAIDYAFKGTSISNVTMIGGVWLPDASIVTGVHPTGTYGASCVAYFIGCTNCHVTRIVSASNFYGVLNFYNSSDCTATFNYLTDNAGGIQALADSGLTGSSTMRGIDFSHNIIEHSGDDGLSFLISATNNGSISVSKIAFNHITKDIGAKGTVGQARGIALVGGLTSSSNNIFDVIVTGNTGYYMHQGFIRATGVIRSVISNNSVNSYAQAGSSYAFAFGDISTGAYGVVDCTFDANVATTPLTTSKAFVSDGAVRCRFRNNYAIVSIGGEGTIRLDNANACVIDGNTFHNNSAYGIQLAATSQYCRIINNDLSIYSVAAISDAGTANFKDGNNGHVNRAVSQTSIANTSTSVVVTHGVKVTSAARLRVRITPLENWFSGTKWWVSGYSTTQFTVNISPAPGAGNTVYFEWEAYESQL